jgi:hypothetical protein
MRPKQTAALFRSRVTHAYVIQSKKFSGVELHALTYS